MPTPRAFTSIQLLPHSWPIGNALSIWVERLMRPQFSSANPEGYVTFHSLRGQLQSSSEALPWQGCMLPTISDAWWALHCCSVWLCEKRCCHLSAIMNYSSPEGNPSSLKSKIIWKLDSERCYFLTSESETLHNFTSSAQLPAQNYASSECQARQPWWRKWEKSLQVVMCWSLWLKEHLIKLWVHRKNSYNAI